MVTPHCPNDESTHFLKDEGTVRVGASEKGLGFRIIRVSTLTWRDSMKVGSSAETTAFMFLSGICKLSCFISRFQSEGRNFTTQLKCIRVS